MARLYIDSIDHIDIRISVDEICHQQKLRELEFVVIDKDKPIGEFRSRGRVVPQNDSQLIVKQVVEAIFELPPIDNLQLMLFSPYELTGTFFVQARGTIKRNYKTITKSLMLVNIKGNPN